MSKRAELAAIKAYPKEKCMIWVGNVGSCEMYINGPEQKLFKEGYEQAEKEIIEKAMRWIEYNNENGGCLFDGWEKDFRKAMEEER